MKADLKRHMMGLLNTQGHCREISRALFCEVCGPKMQKAKGLYDRLKREEPELLVYKRPEFKPSEDTKEMFGKLMERVKKDSVYRKHLEKLAHGTEEEKDKEIKKSNEGYYRTHGI